MVARGGAWGSVGERGGAWGSVGERGGALHAPILQRAMHGIAPQLCLGDSEGGALVVVAAILLRNSDFITITDRKDMR